MGKRSALGVILCAAAIVYAVSALDFPHGPPCVAKSCCSPALAFQECPVPVLGEKGVNRTAQPRSTCASPSCCSAAAAFDECPIHVLGERGFASLQDITIAAAGVNAGCPSEFISSCPSGFNGPEGEEVVTVDNLDGCVWFCKCTQCFGEFLSSPLPPNCHACVLPLAH